MLTLLIDYPVAIAYINDEPFDQVMIGEGLKLYIRRDLYDEIYYQEYIQNSALNKKEYIKGPKRKVDAYEAVEIINAMMKVEEKLSLKKNRNYH